MQNDKWIFVTSGERGIGAGIVRRLAAEGYKVIFTYHTQQDQALQFTDEIKLKGGDCHCYYCDVRDQQGVKQLCTDLINDYGAPYGVINNAGIKNDKLLVNTEMRAWQTVIDTNLNGTFHVIHSMISAMIAAGNGCVITLSSVSALRGNIGQTSYAASKAAQLGLTQSLAREVGRFNIRVNNIAPGLIETEMFSSLSPHACKSLIAQTALRKVGGTDDIARMVSFLLGEGGNYITGQTMIIDGGLSI